MVFLWFSYCYPMVSYGQLVSGGRCASVSGSWFTETATGAEPQTRTGKVHSARGPWRNPHGVVKIWEKSLRKMWGKRGKMLGECQENAGKVW